MALPTIEKLVLATHNAGKVAEIGAMLAPMGIHVVSAGELNLPEPYETETTFVGNALLRRMRRPNPQIFLVWRMIAVCA